MNPETNKPYDTVIMWRVNQLCTFTCNYCDPSLYSLDKNNKYSDKIESFFKETDRTFLLCMTGGEPFLYPNFVELCENVTKNHYIGIFTNLTVNNVFDFALRVDPQRVEFMNCSVHMKEREKRNKVEDFITKFLYLRQKGFNVVATIVGDPPVLERFSSLFSFFQKHDITLIIQNLQGFYRGMHYPEGYTEKEREQLSHYGRLSEPEIQRTTRQFGPAILDTQFMQGRYSWKGLPCTAGKDFIYLEYDGTFTRCLTEKEELGSINTGELRLHDKTKICNAEVCKCPYHGMKFAVGKPKLILFNTPPSGLKSYAKSIVNMIPLAGPVLRKMKKSLPTKAKH